MIDLRDAYGDWSELFDTIFYGNRNFYHATLANIIRMNPYAEFLRAHADGITRGPDLKCVQFWDNEVIPDDVLRFTRTWTRFWGDRYVRFSDATADAFIAHHFEPRVVEAYRTCWHPAMKSDFFRLCYLYVEGGIYIDADEILLHSAGLAVPSSGDFIALQPILRRNTGAHWEGIEYQQFITDAESRVGAEPYFNNSPILCSRLNPVIGLSLMRAMALIQAGNPNNLSVHDVTGPSNISLCCVIYLLIRGMGRAPHTDILSIDWKAHARDGSEEELAYKRDERDWRKN